MRSACKTGSGVLRIGILPLMQFRCIEADAYV